VLPVVTIEEMRAIDAEATEPEAVLVERAGAAVARAALDLLGGAYGRRVVVVAGPGNNGADGRVAADRLRRRGVRTIVFDLADAPAVLPEADLVIDAALGTGIGRPYEAPDPGAALVLAVDIPSGIHGDTGEVLGAPMRADLTVTFAALKPGLVLGGGPAHTGAIRIADIGLDASRAATHLLDDAAAAARLPRRRHDAHKWHQSVLVVAGSPGMTGAAALTAGAAQRAGAGMVRLATPGLAEAPDAPLEVVTVAVDESGWADALLDDPRAPHAVAIGPGLGTSMATRHQARTLVARTPAPVVVDGDGLTALGADAGSVLASRSTPTVLTPHDGEFERLAGHRPGRDRIAEARRLAAATGATVLLKGPTTVVASPGGEVRLVRAGDQRLATAGTGDVLTGVIAALLAAGADGLDAASVGAHVHGLAGRAGPAVGTVASDVVAGIPVALARLLGLDP
jgi:ADP-dependent NAD(P)H-hydrate dehydratase / NAD(P)H-hydrate epimerase